MADIESDWKLKLRYGRLKTDFKHFTVLSDGMIEVPNSEFETAIGPSIMGLKVWVTDIEEVEDIVRAVGRNLGFNANGEIQIYESEPEQPPSKNPSAYGANFTAYS